MSWRIVTVPNQREEFVCLARGGGVSMAELCRRFGVSRKTGYKWLGRFGEGDREALKDASRRPHHSPNRTGEVMEQAVLALRSEFPYWGARKLRRVLQDRGVEAVPAASTVNGILRRQGLLEASQAAHPGPHHRFQHPAPNDLWPMDFKGPITLPGGDVHLLSVLDDHSRFLLLLKACPDERGVTVREALIPVFRTYGLPDRLLVDNGSPWGYTTDHPYTAVSVWLLRLGIGVTHGRPYHPQTQGKVEKFNGTLVAEFLQGASFPDSPAMAISCTRYRELYNTVRPHHALGLDTPVSHYHPSPRSYPEQLPPIEYGPGDDVRRVHEDGCISFRGRLFKVGKGFRGYPVAVRPATTDGQFGVHFLTHRIATLDCTTSANNEGVVQ